jgi:hypothetical protein
MAIASSLNTRKELRRFLHESLLWNAIANLDGEKQRYAYLDIHAKEFSIQKIRSRKRRHFVRANLMNIANKMAVNHRELFQRDADAKRH